jgi:hypothetical protein
MGGIISPSSPIPSIDHPVIIHLFQTKLALSINSTKKIMEKERGRHTFKILFKMQNFFYPLSNGDLLGST